MQPMAEIRFGEADKAQILEVTSNSGRRKHRESSEQAEIREQPREKVTKTCKVEEDSQC